MKLYYSKGACSLVVRIVIHELGLPFDYEAVNLKTKVTATGENYLTINPKGAVPAILTDDNMLLTENSVIQQYLADKEHATQLLPAIGDFKRYQVLEWVNFISTDIHKGFGPLFNPIIPDTMKTDIFIPNLISKFALVNKALEKTPYLCGDHFTLPDAYLFVMLLWAHSRQFDLSSMPSLLKYFDELKLRKTIIDAMAEE